jgi:curved DNA-binding protein CbpA
MDKLNDPNTVKKYYRKAMIMCHPDKMTNESNSDKIFIANRVFSAINEAFNEYKSEPGVNLS